MNTLCALFLICSFVVPLKLPAVKDILKELDGNLSAKTLVFTSKIVIRRDDGSSRTIESRTWIRGKDKAFSEYLSHGPEKGTRMLKLKETLWIYSSSTGWTEQISGPMLHRSLMGSDLSYKNMMENPKLSDHYDAKMAGMQDLDGRRCWVLDLTAKTGDAAYPGRRLWVDQLRYVPLVAELYDQSGKLLKHQAVQDIAKIQGRWFPRRITFKDALKKGQRTELIIETITFDHPIPEHIFSRDMLAR